MPPDDDEFDFDSDFSDPLDDDDDDEDFDDFSDEPLDV